MLFYIKQKVFSFKDKFTIKDELGKDVYQLKGKVISLHNKIEFMDMQEEVLLKIYKKAISFRPTYYIDDAEENRLCMVKRKLSFMKPKFDIDLKGRSISLQGSFWQHNFVIEEEGNVLATISKKILSFGDAYEIDIQDEDKIEIMLAIVVIIDQILHEEKHRN